MARSKKRKSKKKKTNSAGTSGAAAAPTSDSNAPEQLPRGESEVQATAPAQAMPSEEAEKENEFVHELTHSVDPIAHALTAIDKTDIDYKLDGDCPFCLEPPHWHPKKRVMMFCCGAEYCTKCINERNAHLLRSLERKGYGDKADLQLYDHCSLCRQKCPLDGTDDEAWLLENAAKGRAWAQHFLGVRHLIGKEVARPNSRLGIELIARSAKQGYPLVLHELGHMYIDGSSRFGIKKSSSNARFCFEEAANRGHTRASFELARIEILEGKREGMEAAAKHLQIAADAGYPKAIFTLGWFLYQGSDGDEKKMTLAISYLEEAANLGNQDAVDFLKEHFD